MALENIFQKKFLFIKNKKKISPIFILLITLLLLNFIIFYDFLFYRLYIYTDIGSDTYQAYIPYYNWLFRNIKYTGDLPFWSHSFATGNNTFSITPLYTDPFILFLLVGYYFYDIKFIYILPYLAILKIFFSGYLFFKYITYLKINNYTAIISSLLYAFNGYIILWGQHYHFATIIVFVPLVLWCSEIFIKENKWVGLCFSITLVGVFSYYFLYMLSLFLFFYLLVRYIEDHGTKNILSWILRFLFVYLLGVGLSSFSFLPSIYAALNSGRVNINTNIFKHVPLLLSNFLDVPIRLCSNDILRINNNFLGHWNYYETPILYSGIISVVLLGFYFFIKNNQLVKYRTYWMFLLFILLFPYASLVFNGFSAFTYRWTFIFIFFQVFIIAKLLNELTGSFSLKFNKKTALCNALIICIILLTSILIYQYIKDWESKFTKLIFERLVIIFFFIFLYSLLLVYINKNIAKNALFAFVCIEICLFSRASFYEGRTGLDQSYMNSNNGYFDNSYQIMKDIYSANDEFFRADKNYQSVGQNDQLIQNYKGLNGYGSLNNPYYVNFLKNLGVLSYNKNKNRLLVSVDDSALMSLLSIKYLISNSYSYEKIPYGFSKIRNYKNLNLLYNNNFLPLGFIYSTYTNQKDFNSLDNTNKALVLLKAGVVEEKLNQTLSSNHKLDLLVGVKDFWQSIKESKVTILNSKININNFPHQIELGTINENPQIIISYDKEINTPYLDLSMNVTSDHETTGRVLWGESNNFQSFNIFKGSRNYKIYLKNLKTNFIKIDIVATKSIYKIKNLYVRSVDPDTYKLSIENLKENGSFEISKYSNDYIEGLAKLKVDGLLFLSIPYDKGWKIKVNEKDQPLQKVNIGFIGVFIIRIKYY